jgi:P27 family predicted phage terminase small subunit
VEVVGGAAAVYREYGEKLIKSKVLTELDLPALIQFSVWWAKWAEAEASLAVDQAVLAGDSGGYYQNPLVSIAKQAAQMVDKWGALLGLNPSDRTRLKVAAPEPQGFLDD